MYLVRKLQQNFLSWMTFVLLFIYVFKKGIFSLSCFSIQQLSTLRKYFNIQHIIFTYS